MGRFEVLLLFLAVSGPLVVSLTTFRVNGTVTCSLNKQFRYHVILMEDDDIGGDDVVAVQHTSSGWGTAGFTLAGNQSLDWGGEFEVYLRIIHTCRNWEGKPDLTWEIPLGDFSKDKREVTLYNYNFNITNKGDDVYTVGGKKRVE